MKKILTILVFMLLGFNLSGQLMSPAVGASQSSAVRTYEDVIDDYGVAWHVGAVANYTTVGDTVISQWDDETGNGNHLTQGGIAARPHYSGSVVTFDGADDWMKDDYVLVQPTFLFLVIKQVTWTIWDKLIDGYTGGGGALYQHTTTPKVKPYAGAYDGEISPTRDTWVIIRVLWHGASSKIILNGGVPVTGNFGTTDMDGIILGAASGGGSPSDCAFQEVIVFSSALSSADETLVLDHLNDTYTIY